MKKVVSGVLALILCLSLCACGVSLTAEQKEVRTNADEFFTEFAELKPGSTFESSIKKIDGHIIYYGVLDFNVKFDAVSAVQSTVMPYAKELLSEGDMYIVLEIEENGEDKYRFVDPRLDPDILD